MTTLLPLRKSLSPTNPWLLQLSTSPHPPALSSGGRGRRRGSWSLIVLDSSRGPTLWLWTPVSTPFPSVLHRRGPEIALTSEIGSGGEMMSYVPCSTRSAPTPTAWRCLAMPESGSPSGGQLTSSSGHGRECLAPGLSPLAWGTEMPTRLRQRARVRRTRCQLEGSRRWPVRCGASRLWRYGKKEMKHLGRQERRLSGRPAREHS